MGNLADKNNINMDNDTDIYVKTVNNKEKDLTPYLNNLKDNYYAYKPDSMSTDSTDSIVTNNSSSFDDNSSNILNTLKLNKSVDAGATATVFFGYYQNKKCAVKVLSKKNRRSKILFKTECEHLKGNIHQNIVKILGKCKDNKNYYIIMERGSMDLANFRMKFIMSEKHVKLVVRSLLSALQLLHKNNICHRDIKPENILFKNDDYLIPILIDFGESIKLDNDNNVLIPNPLLGTPNYLSPERLLYRKLSSNSFKKSDIWAIGVVTFELLIGRHIFDGTNQNIFDQILNFDWNIFTQYMSDEMDELSKNCQHFIKQCLIYDPKKRINAQQALNHEWFICT